MMKLVRFENCIPVKGANRSVICDLQRGIVRLIPNSLYEILKIHNGKSVDEIKRAYNNEYDSIIDEYVSFLLEHEFAFLTENPESFPKMDRTFHNASRITNAIFDIGNEEAFYVEKALKEFPKLGVEALQIRIFQPIKEDKLSNLLSVIKDSQTSIKGIELILPFGEYLTEVKTSHLMGLIPTLMSLVVHSAPYEKTIKYPYQDGAV